MNKQEAIERIEKRKSTLNGWEELTRNRAFNEALDIVRKIDETEKPIVPQFVAEWIESQKKSFSDVSAIDMYDNLTLDNNGGHHHDVWLWVIAYHYDFIKAWHDGYEVEQEPLYTVEIPNPNSNWNYTFLTKKDYRGVIIHKTDDDCWRKDKNNHLTEAEIKQDFDWAWNAGFAKEVEV